MTDCPGIEFAHLTFPRFRGWLKRQGLEKKNILAFGEVAEGCPAGLAIAACAEPPHRHARLLSLMVASQFRRRGLGLALLTRIERESAARGCADLSASFSSRLTERALLERLFAAAGWQAPAVAEVRVAGTVDAAFQAMDSIEPSGRPYLPPGATLDLWASLRGEEEAQVAELAENLDFEANVDPAFFAPASHPALSLVLRYEGRVAGWVFGSVVSAPSEPVVCGYFAGYTIPGLRRRGALIGMMREVCVRQRSLFGPSSRMRMSSLPGVPGMPHFIRRRLGPHADWVDELLRTTKQLPSAKWLPAG